MRLPFLNTPQTVWELPTSIVRSIIFSVKFEFIDVYVFQKNGKMSRQSQLSNNNIRTAAY
jgi:hypothetical protein